MSNVSLGYSVEELDDQLLQRLVASRQPVLQALSQLAGFHLGQGTYAPFRDSHMSDGGRLFPHPMDVPDLTVLLLHQVDGLWARCENPEDDLRTAAFAFHNLLAIQPFANANGRVSMGLLQLLLMHRWGRKAPALALPIEAHQILWGLFRPLDSDCDGTAVGFDTLRRSLARRIVHADLRYLKEAPAYSAAATWLKRGARAN